MKELIEKATVLLEALPYIRRFHGKRFVVKYGGHAMIDEKLQMSFARDISLMRYVGLHPIVVHGGGPQIDQTLSSMGVVSERIDGLRVTDEKTMQVVEMVLGGQVNQEIVSLITQQGGRAVGLSGKDDSFIVADKAKSMKTKQGKDVDPGRVGIVREVHPQILEHLISGGFIPVIAPIAVDDDGRSLNVNADLVASEVAQSIGAEKLVLLTDIEGVCDRNGTLIPSLTGSAASDLRKAGVISGGMIPKVECALQALKGGVKKCHIVDGRLEHAVLLEIFTDHGIGTEISA